MLSVATLSMGTLIAAGCSDSDTTTDGSGASGAGTSATTTGNSMGGSSGMCAPQDACERCAATECPTEALACCEATGCIELVTCVGKNCQDAENQTTCAGAECPTELQMGSGSIAQAQALGDCLTPVLTAATDGDCKACADEFGTGTGGGGGAGGN